MRQASKSVEQYLRPAPGWCGGRHIEDQPVTWPAEAAIDVRLFWQFLFPQPDPHPCDGTLELVDLGAEVHPDSLRLAPAPRNLEVLLHSLVR